MNIPYAVVSFLVMILCIYFLSIITDKFFIKSLDQISTLLKLPNNVAGASLMAMGSSAPELAIALLALFTGEGEHSDLGIGTIVGSAVFNILVITGISAMVRPAQITWLVVVRDCVIYVSSIVLLLATFSDGVITIIEAFSFVILYVVYIYILFQWNKFMPETEEEMEQTVEAISKGDRSSNPLAGINHWLGGKIGILAGDAEKSYIRAFIVSILFIALISWFLVEATIIFSESLLIPPIIVALTLLAAGTSVPDLIASMIVAKQGRGDMAVANAVGSNIFDILIGLGIPWMLAMVLLGQEIHVGTGDLWLSTVILLGTVFLLFIFLTTERLLSRIEGGILLLVYIAYVIWTWLG